MLDLSFIKRIISVYNRKGVATLSASLAYYMLFSVFPSLVVIKIIIDSLSVDKEWLFIINRLPDSIEKLISEYLVHAESFDTKGILAGGIFLSVFSLVKFVRNLKYHLDTINGVRYKRMFLLSWVFALVMALWFLMILYLLLICVVFGQTILKLLVTAFGDEETFVVIWKQVRVAAVAFLLVFFLVMIFRFLPDKKSSLVSVLPGVIFTGGAWFLSSAVFSLYINNFSRYSLVYGSLGAVIILMLWFYVLSNIILTGACINLVFSSKDL